MNKQQIAPTTKKPRPSPVRIVIVDDHPLVCEGLVMLFCSAPDFQICGQASGIAEACKLAADVRPDVAIVDLTLKDGNGLDLIKKFKEDYPEIKSLVLTMHEESLFAERAMRAGAVGYIDKQQASRTILHAIREVLDGKFYLSERISQRVMQLAFGSPRDEQPGSKLDLLTDRELDVFCRIGRGMTTEAIASALKISQKTVHVHKGRIKEKLDLKNSIQLTQHAVQWVLEHQ